MFIEKQIMSSPEKNAFIFWLDQELGLRGWNDNQLAKRAGISHSVISKARSGSLPKWGACEAIAAALQLPAELVFRKAGLLSPSAEEDAALEEWRYVLSQLPPAEREELLQIARLKLARQERDAQSGEVRPRALGST